MNRQISRRRFLKTTAVAASGFAAPNLEAPSKSVSDRREFLKVSAVGALGAVIVPEVMAAAEPTRPNIIVILADDMGFSDIGCYGGEVHTPNLDKLAARGLRFSQFYNCALCGPSRAALMTGLYPHQAGVTAWTGLLRNNCVTMFEVLKRAGYTTCAVGRLDMVTAEDWHEPGNIAHHADRFFGSTGHIAPGNYFADVRSTAFYRDGKPYSLPEGGYKTDLITDFTVEFLQQRDKAKPFLLYMAHYAPHWPLHAKPEDIARYRGLYRRLGWDAAREQRLKHLVEKGILPPKTKLSPRDVRAAPWSETPYLDWEAERMAVYAAQIDCLDQSVGRVMDTLRSTGADKNTLMFFLSDNGASDQSVGQLDKPGETWRLDGTPTRAGNAPDIPPGRPDTFVTAGPAWASVSNTPFRDHKCSNFEGGISTPLIASWPGVIRQTGAITHEIGHIADIMASCLDVAGVEYPGEFNGRNVLPLEGKSLLPVLAGSQRDGHKALCWATAGSRAIRAGKWKLVAAKGGAWELFDVEADRAETCNLAVKCPDIVNDLTVKWEQWVNSKQPTMKGRQS